MGAVLLHLRGAAGMDAIYRKAGWRVLPLLMLCYATVGLDRASLGYVQAQMGRSLGFDTGVHAWGTLAFLAGSLLAALPATLLVARRGVRRTLPLMLLGWALAAAAAALVHTASQFYLARLMLGVLSAGVLPGLVWYLTNWYPAPRRACMLAILASAILAAGIGATLGAPALAEVIRAALPGLHHNLGLAGWQSLLLLQGLCAAALAASCALLLVEQPDQAGWLAPAEQQLMAQDLTRAAARVQAGMPARHAGLLPRDPVLYLLALCQALVAAASWTLLTRMPALLQLWSGRWRPEPLALLPGVAAIAGMILLARDSDRRGERRGHFLACMLFAAGGLGLMIAADQQLAWSLAGLMLAAIGAAGATPLFFTIVADQLAPRDSAAGIALACCAGVAGAASSPLLDAAAQRLGAGHAGLLALLAVLFLAAGATLWLALRRRVGGAQGGLTQTHPAHGARNQEPG